MSDKTENSTADEVGAPPGLAPSTVEWARAIGAAMAPINTALEKAEKAHGELPQGVKGSGMFAMALAGALQEKTEWTEDEMRQTLNSASPLGPPPYGPDVSYLAPTLTQEINRLHRSQASEK
ncbi:hypothetical protein ACFYPB_40315 [Streptomyces olivaceoviridis]|uniref:hypothetical protein n=1 Tax=Streptomyces olivaceoviridis TaxID=1921 RepID=UPI0036CB4276